MRKTADAVRAGKTGLINGVVVGQKRDHCNCGKLQHKLFLLIMLKTEGPYTSAVIYRYYECRSYCTLY